MKTQVVATICSIAACCTLTGYAAEPWCYYRCGGGAPTNLGTSATAPENIRLGDFNGDRITDVFVTTGTEWKIAYSGTSGFKSVNSFPSTIRIQNLLIGDFDRDGNDDVFFADGRHWFYSSAATGGFRKLQANTVTVPNLRVGDFDGDGASDLLTISKGKVLVSAGGRKAWRLVNSISPSIHLGHVAIGDFDGNKSDDLFYTDGRQWKYSPEASGGWLNLSTSGARLANMRFGDFNRDGRTDVLTSTGIGGQLRINFGGNSGWKDSGKAKHDLKLMLVGDFDGDRASDIFVATP